MKDLARQFEEILTIPLFSGTKTRRDPGVKDEFVGILLRHQGLFRDTYYLNHRPSKEDDDIYSNKFGLFAGKIEKTPTGDQLESEAEAAEREIKEETSLNVGQDFYLIVKLAGGKNNAGRRTNGTIFLKVLRKSPYRIIKKYLAKENPRLASIGDNPVGNVIPIHRYRGGIHFFVRWWRLTPQALFALRDVFDRDPTKIDDSEKTEASMDIGPHPERPPVGPEEATCSQCGGHVSRDDQYRGVCPHCGENL